MDVDLLINSYKTAVKSYTNDTKKVLDTINVVSDFSMYEQEIIKKDYISATSSYVYYDYDLVSYEAINKLYSSIRFIEEPVIGASKRVFLRGMDPDTEFSNKVYILDKVRDTFMHLKNGKTQYTFIDDYENIELSNVLNDYSLKCIIPTESILEFNRIIKDNFYNSDPMVRWIDKLNDKPLGYNYSRLPHFDNLVVVRRFPDKKIILDRNSPQKLYAIHSLSGLENMSESEYLSYHTYSYLTLFNSENHDYPILSELYKLDFSCTHSEYINKCGSVIDKLIRYENAINRDYVHLDREKNMRRIDVLMHHLVDDMNCINSMLVNHLRNARAHANKIGDDTLKITYFNVRNNSGEINPSDYIFRLVGTNGQMDRLFDEINGSIISKNDYANILTSDIKNENLYGDLMAFIDQLESFLLQCKKDNVSPDIDTLFDPIGNADNFIDFLRKIVSDDYISTNSISL